MYLHSIHIIIISLHREIIMAKSVYYPTTNTTCSDNGGGGGGAVDSVNGITGAVVIDVEAPLKIRKEGNKIIISADSMPTGNAIETINGIKPDANKDFKINPVDPSKINPIENGIEIVANIKVETDNGTATSENSLLVDKGNQAQGVSTSSPASAPTKKRLK